MDDFVIMAWYVYVIIGVAGALLIGVLTVAIKLVKSDKAKRVLVALLEGVETALSVVPEAERFANFTGEEKKAYVMTKIAEYLASRDLVVPSEQLGALVDNIVATGNAVKPHKLTEVDNNGA